MTPVFSSFKKAGDLRSMTAPTASLCLLHRGSGFASDSFQSAATQIPFIEDADVNPGKEKKHHGCRNESHDSPGGRFDSFRSAEGSEEFRDPWANQFCEDDASSERQEDKRDAAVRDHGIRTPNVQAKQNRDYGGDRDHPSRQAEIRFELPNFERAVFCDIQ